MQARELESLFLAYRDEADVDALSQVFDRAAPELQTLARHLVREPSEAEDLLQETFLTAIERANDWQRDRRLLPWLVGILALAARRRARERSRTPDPRRINSPVDTAPDSSASAHEFRAEVERALAALPQEERELLSQYLLDERKPHEIAGEQGLAPGTVRMRIQRALESLRRLLPVGAALGGAALLTSPRTLAEVRREVLARGRERAPELAAASTGLLAGIAALPKSLLSIALVASAGLVTWLALQPGSGQRPEGNPGSLAAGPALAHGEPRAARIEAGSAAGERSPALDAGVVAGGDWVRIAIEEPTRFESGALRILVKAIGEEAELRPSLPASRELLIDVSSLARGSAHPSSLLVRLDHSDYMPETVSVEWPSTDVAPGRREARAAVRLRPALAFVEGTIALEGLEPDPRGLLALVSWNEPGANMATILDQADQVAPGRFRLRSPHGGPLVLVVAHAGAAPLSTHVELTPGQSNDVGLLTLEAGLAIRGRVVLPESGAGWRAEIEATARLARDNGVGALQRLAWNGEVLYRGSGSARTGEDGRFEIRGLSKCDYKLRCSLGADSPSARRAFVIGDWTADGMTNSTDVTLDARAPSEDLVVDLSHAARLGFVLRVVSNGQPVPSPELDWLMTDHGSMGTSGDERGETSILVATQSPFRVRVSKAGFVARELELQPSRIEHGSVVEVNLDPGAPLVDLEFDTGEIGLEGMFWATLFPIESLGETRPDALDMTQPRGDIAGRETSRILEDGRFSKSISAGRYWGRIFPHHWPDNQGTTDLLPAAFECKLEPGRRNRVHVEMHHGGRIRIDSRAFPRSQSQIRLALADSSGKSLRAEFWERSLDSSGIPSSRGTVDAVFAGALMSSAPLPAGDYVLTVRPPGKDATEHQITLEPGKSSTLVLSP